jgi:hypothetical protein
MRQIKRMHLHSLDIFIFPLKYATCIPLFASSDMYVAIGHVLIEIFKHVLAVWNTVCCHSTCTAMHLPLPLLSYVNETILSGPLKEKTKSCTVYSILKLQSRKEMRFIHLQNRFSICQ